ncbi:MAG: hypothetical protein U5P41_07395 [Gammaproteobacteria bacterium]|nr:hypothetical protein [Gammaproteobacteria bacterium]
MGIMDTADEILTIRSMPYGARSIWPAVSDRRRGRSAAVTSSMHRCYTRGRITQNLVVGLQRACEAQVHCAEMRPDLYPDDVMRAAACR